MKNIIGFNEDIYVIKCKDCGCIFTIDSGEDIEEWIINNKEKPYVYCPNCKAMCDDLALFQQDTLK